jgi:PIN domain-containing protein
MAKKANPVAIHVILDTNCLFTEAADKLIKQELSEFILASIERKEFQVTWHLPQIVQFERKHQMALRAQRLIPHLEKVESLLGHAFGISKEHLDERVDAVIAREVQRHNLQLRALDTSKVDWNEVIVRSVQRRPPFDPGDKEKGFRDAVALETFCQIIDDLPKSPQSARIVLMSADQLLTEAARERVGARSNVAFTGELEEIRSMLNALASALTQEMVEKIVPVASAIFFETDTKDTLYHRADVSGLIANEYAKELISRPNSFTRSSIKNILINAPAFLAKSGQRLTFSSRITYVAEATKVVSRHPAAAGTGSITNIPTGAVAGLGGTGSTGLLGGLGMLNSISGTSNSNNLGFAGGTPLFGSGGGTGG